LNCSNQWQMLFTRNGFLLNSFLHLPCSLTILFPQTTRQIATFLCP
jgi:hypothetical protein